MLVLLNVVISVVTSGLVSAVVAGLFGLRKDRLKRRSETLASARDALKHLEDVYVGVPVGTFSDDQILVAESQFKAERDKCAHKPLADASEALLENGRLYASGDPDVSISRLQSDLDAVADVIRRRMKRLN